MGLSALVWLDSQRSQRSVSGAFTDCKEVFTSVSIVRSPSTELAAQLDGPCLNRRRHAEESGTRDPELQYRHVLRSRQSIWCLTREMLLQPKHGYGPSISL